jgi:hypothetical protein
MTIVAAVKTVIVELFRYNLRTGLHAAGQLNTDEKPPAVSACRITGKKLIRKKSNILYDRPLLFIAYKQIAAVAMVCRRNEKPRHQPGICFD